MARIRGLVFLLGLVIGGSLAAQQPAGKPPYQREVPAALSAEARIGEDSARTLALLKVPGGRLESVELVRAHGNLVWVWDLKFPGKSEPVEVTVSAVDGHIVKIDRHNAHPELRAGVLSGAIHLDGRLDEPAWQAADSIANLVTIEPIEDTVPAGQTIVKVLASPTELVIGIVCRDTNPNGIVSYSMTRDEWWVHEDSTLVAEDHITVILDPFQDERTGYVFAVNPSGARFDGLVSAQGEDVNSSWDAVWEAKTARDERGWSVEIRIPIRSLSFNPGLASWGFNVERRVQRLQETSRWTGINRDYAIFQTSQAGLLTGLPQFNLGAGLSVRPAMVLKAARDPGVSREWKPDGSLDITKKLGANLVSSLTINTDFAETEVDARQTNLTRFDLLFPEKRSFFLEGADIFEFGLGTNEDLIPFFSRRIGLVGAEGDLQQVPLTAGGKLNGRIGNTNVGALVVRTRRADTLATDATMGVVRIKQNVLAESSVGMIATGGDPLAAPGSWMGGVDFTYQTSELQGDKNLLLGVWGLQNHADTVGDEAFGAAISYPNDLIDASLSYKWIGADFTPSLGFVPRTGVQIWQLQAAVRPRPTGGLIRQMVFEIKPIFVTRLEGGWESYSIELKPLDWELRSGDRFEVNIVPEGDRPDTNFDVFRSGSNRVTVPAGSYQWNRVEVQGGLANKRRINGEATWSTGGYYGGHLTSLDVRLAVKPSTFLRLELGLQRNSGRLPGGRFVQRLGSTRVQVNLSPDFQIASFLQYDNESRTFGSNTRLRWTFNPLGDLFVVYNHNLLRDPANRFHFDSDQLLVKLQYALRL
jgi:hypothetical protein